MQKIIPNKIGLWLTASLVVIGALFYTLPFFLLQDRVLTAQIRNNLQKNLKKTGLIIEIENIHWSGWGFFKCSKVQLKDEKRGIIPFQAGAVNLNIDLLALLKNRRNPESALRKVELIDASVHLKRFKDGTWDLKKNYFTGSKRKLRLNTVFSVKNGTIKLEDEGYGKYNFSEVNGSVRFDSKGIVTWDCNGISDLNNNCRWSSRGEAPLDFKNGHAQITVANLVLDKIAPFIPAPYSIEVIKGVGGFDVKFGWHKDGFWLENGAIRLTGTELELPDGLGLLDVRELDGEISPFELKINIADLIYNNSLWKVSGKLDTKTTAINGVLSGRRVNLADFAKFFPKLLPYQLQGSANLRVDISGDLDRPLLNGELSFNGAELAIGPNLWVKRLTGQTKIINNDLEIKKIEGYLGDTLIGVTGSIANILTPTYNLNVQAVGIDFAEYGLPVPPGLKIDQKVDFKGKVSGELWTPTVSGELQIAKLEYQDLRFENLKTFLNWDSLTNSLQISKLEGVTGDGNLTAKGTVKVSSEGVEWKVSGELADLNLARTKFGMETGIGGKISTNAILKGEWKPGEIFDPGTILGTFKGENFNHEKIGLESIQGVFTWTDHKLLVDSIQARAGRGRIYGHLAWDFQRLSAGFNAERVQLSDLSPLARKYSVDGVFDGLFEFEGPLSDLKGKIQCSLKQTTYLAKPLGEITGSIEYTDQGFDINALQVASETGDYSVKGRIDLAAQPNVNLTMNSDNAQLNGFMQWLPIDPSLRLGGTGTLNFEFFGPIENPNYTAHIFLNGPSVGNFQMERGAIQFEGNFREINLNRMVLTDSDSVIEISGTVDRDNLDLNLKGTRISFDSLGLEFKGATLQGRFDLEGRLLGKPARPLFEAEISSGKVLFGPFSGEIYSGAVDWKEREIRISRINLGGEDFQVNIDGVIGFNKQLRLDLAVDVSDLNLVKLCQVLGVSGFDAEGKLEGLINITGDPYQPVINIDGELTKAVFSGAPVEGEFELGYQNKRLLLKQLKLRQYSGSLLATGVWEPDSVSKLQINAKDFSLAPFGSFLGPDLQFDGAIDLESDLTWSSAGIFGETQAKVNGLSLNRNRLGDLQLRGNFKEQGFYISESILNTKNGSVGAHGYLPWPEQFLSIMKRSDNSGAVFRSINLEFGFKNTSLEIINSYLPENVTVTNGLVNGNLKIQGRYGWPVFSGNLEATNIGIAVSDLPLPITNMRAAVEIERNRISIQQARGGYGNGRFTLNGELLLFGEEDQLHFDLNLDGSKLYYRNNYFDGYADAKLQLSGTPADSKLSGDVRLFETKVGILKISKEKASSIAWNPSFDLRVTTGKNVRYRQIGLADIEVESDLRIGGDLQKPLISGEANSDKGVLTLYGQTFKVKNAKAAFKFSQGFNPYIDVDSRMSTPAAEVILTVKGQIGENLAINLYSYPPLAEEDLFAMLNWSELRGDKPLTVKGVATTNLSMITDTVFGEVFYELRQALDLDYLYLERDFIEDEFRVNLGEYVSDGLFLSYSRSLSDQPKEKWELEYYLTSNLIVGGSFPKEEETSWRLTYRFRF
ncbi:MAG: hypothetical protein GX075_07835 [Firmicutes bacterium]|nr:hypothetical protein [Bacillota bacterium]